MAIKNYTTKVPASRSIQEIQDSLVEHGAIGFQMIYEKGTGKISSLQFILDVKGKEIPFSLPVNWRLFQEVMKQEGNKRYMEEDYCYRVAWRCIQNWVLAQMALYETEMVDLPQVFLPFAMNGQKSLYDSVVEGGLLLGEGKE
jgi:hypothetical protein